MARNRAASGSPRTSSSAFPSVSDHSAPIATPLARDRVLATPAFSGVDREVPESPPQSLDRQVAARPGEDADAAALRDDLPDARHRQPHPAGQAPHLLPVIGAPPFKRNSPAAGAPRRPVTYSPSPERAPLRRTSRPGSMRPRSATFRKRAREAQVSPPTRDTPNRRAWEATPRATCRA